MEFKNFIYIISISLLFLIFLLFSFNRKLNFWVKFKYIFPSILISASFFIIWGTRFTEFEFWKYNPEFLVKLYLFRLPIEEWSYYIVLPLIGFLIYELVKTMIKQIGKINYYVVFSLFLLALLTLTTYFSRHLVYTFVIFIFLTIYFGYTVLRNRFKPHYSFFYISFLISLVPFFILNIILTGLPIVVYNSEYILKIYLFSIPVENIAGFFLLFLMNISIYEYLIEKRFF
jgi:lycopene cyclase domain-containing protein